MTRTPVRLERQAVGVSSARALCGAPVPGAVGQRVQTEAECDPSAEPAWRWGAPRCRSGGMGSPSAGRPGRWTCRRATSRGRRCATHARIEQPGLQVEVRQIAARRPRGRDIGRNASTAPLGRMTSKAVLGVNARPTAATLARVVPFGPGRDGRQARGVDSHERRARGIDLDRGHREASARIDRCGPPDRAADHPR